jgi:hypothetical protein
MTDTLDENLIPNRKKQRILSKPLLLFAGLVTVSGYIFKIQHWPMSGVLITIGSGVISGHLIARSISQKKSFSEIPSVFIIVIVLTSMIFLRMNMTAFFIYAGVIGVIGVIEYFLVRKDR